MHFTRHVAVSKKVTIIKNAWYVILLYDTYMIMMEENS